MKSETKMICRSETDNDSSDDDDDDDPNQDVDRSEGNSDVSDSEADSEFDVDDDEAENDDNVDLDLDYDMVAYRRMPCFAHTLQLVVKKVYGQQYEHLISKARGLVGKIRKSSKAVESLVKKCANNVISDNSTRWNSTYYMIRRLLKIKVAVNEVLADMKVDSLLVAEWTRLEELRDILEPFATQTNILQSDSQSLSYAVPTVLDLNCHLQQFSSSSSTLTGALLQELEVRFAFFLNPFSDNFNPLPAAACLLDPTVAVALFAPEHSDLVDAAKDFIIKEVRLLQYCDMICIVNTPYINAS